MKPQTVLTNPDHSSDGMTAARSAANDPERLLDSRDLLNNLKKNLEILRDNYLQLTETEFYSEVSVVLEKTKQRLNPVDPFSADWTSGGVLLNDYEAKEDTRNKLNSVDH